MLVNKTLLGFSFKGAFLSQEARRAGWESVSQQASPFQRREPLPSRGGGGGGSLTRIIKLADCRLGSASWCRVAEWITAKIV